MPAFPRLIPALVTLITFPLAAAAQSAIQLLPANNAANVPPDIQFHLTFPAPPTAGTGKIQIFDAADNSLVESIDPAARTRTKTIGGLPNFVYYPILISQNESIITLDTPLAYHKTYYVTLDTGALKDSQGHDAAIADHAAWRFSTQPAPPAAATGDRNPRKVTISADGSADFATLQGALDWVPDGNTTPVTLFLKKGTYNEIVFFTGKDAITILGEDRKSTIIQYANNDRFNNNAGGNPFGTAAGPTTATRVRGAIYHRGMFLAHRVHDLTIANLTLHNTTPRGGSQAEAIILNGTTDARAIITRCDLLSYQDTLQINGQAYVSDCYIEGDVDYMWGTGPVFFENCRCTSSRSRAYYTQIRNPATNHGYVYHRCTFDGTGGITGNYLARIDPTRFPHSEVVLIDCTLTPAVGSAAWLLTNATAAPDVHFWEYNSHAPDGKPVDTSGRAPFSRQLKTPDDQETITHYSDPTWVLGGKWTPKPPAP